VKDFVTYGVVSSSEALPFEDDAFEESRCVGQLHHLSHASALLTIKEMIRCTRQDGRIVIFDNVWPRQTCFRPLAWLTRKLDRGKWIRAEEGLLELVNSA
jgi:SAM-dependent methyltransferase